jgi:hypothetical protein
MDQRITAILDYARAGAAAAPPHPVDTAQVAAAAARDVSKVLDEARCAPAHRGAAHRGCR